MNHIKLSEDRSTVAIGPANHWIDVYSALEPLGLTVVGGRAAGVGVGGFLLGGELAHEMFKMKYHLTCPGGISWFSNLYGWGCDNITAYEVVLADGSIVTASKDSFQDLYKGLRGGAGNLGIVTTFHVRAHPYTGMFAGHKAFDNRYGDEATKAFIDIGRISDHEDRKCFYLLSLNADNNVWQWGATVAYCDAIVNPPCLQASNDIPSIVDDCKLRHQTESVIQLQAQYPVWLQCGIWTFATQVDLKTLRICCEIWKEEMKPVIDEVEGFMPILAVQYMSAAVIENAGRDGGNVTGLAGTRPFILYNSEPRWSNARDNTRVSIGINKAFQRMSVEARRLGTNHEYRYSNYASEYQDPISSYGVGPNEFLCKVSRKYDPDGILQTLRSSGFNLSGAPRRIQELDPGVKL